MKSLLTLLLLIPSLSWGIDYYRKDIPVTKTELNYLFGYELGTKFDEKQLTNSGLESFNKQLSEDNKVKFINLSRTTENDKNDEKYDDLISNNIVNKNFSSVGLYLDKEDLTIERIYLYKSIEGEDIRNQLSGILNLLNLTELDGVSLTTCEEFKSTVIDAYQFKRQIKEEPKSYYEYVISTESGKENTIEQIQSITLLKDKNDNYLNVDCYYRPWFFKDEINISTTFIFRIISSDNIKYFKNTEETEKTYQTFEIDKKEFKNLLSITFELNTDGL